MTINSADLQRKSVKNAIETVERAFMDKACELKKKTMRCKCIEARSQYGNLT